MHGIRITRSLGRRRVIATAAVASGALLIWSPAHTAASGNVHFDNILAASRPSGFTVSPSAYDLSHGAVTVNFDVSVRNLTSSRQLVALNFSLTHILTYNGANVADGQPGKAGITFSGPQGTSQAMMPGTQSFTATWAAHQTVVLSRSYSLNSCGYYQVDVWAPEGNGDSARHRETLASGFIRALKCNADETPTPTPTETPTPTPTETPTPTPTPTPQGGGPTPTPGGGSGGVQGISTPSTGSPLVTPGSIAGLILLAAGTVLLVGTRRGRRVDI